MDNFPDAMDWQASGLYPSYAKLDQEATDQAMERAVIDAYTRIYDKLTEACTAIDDALGALLRSADHGESDNDRLGELTKHVPALAELAQRMSDEARRFAGDVA